MSLDVITEIQCQIELLAQTSLASPAVESLVSREADEKYQALRIQLNDLQRRCEQTETCCELLRSTTADSLELGSRLKAEGGAIAKILAENDVLKQRLALVMKEVAKLRCGPTLPGSDLNR